MPDRSKTDLPPAQDFDMGLLKQDYFHGLLPREDAAVLLTKHGDFLIRLSEADTMGARLETVLSVLHDPKSRCKGNEPEARMDFMMHIIVQCMKKRYFVVTYRTFNSVVDLIAFYLRHQMIFKSQVITLNRAVGLASWEFRAENIQLDDVIGKCSSGEVRRGQIFRKDTSPMEVAVKTVAGRSMEAKERVRDLMAQCRLLNELYHPCVVQYIGVCLIAQPNCFFFEYVSHGSLHDYLRANNDLKRDELLLMICSAGWGLEYLHQNTILHRDIAAKNCFYDRQFVKLSGFSKAKKASNYTMKTVRKLAIRWMAPETIDAFLYSQKSDVYGYGILIYEIFSAKEPYEGLSNADAKTLILQSDLVDFPGRTPKKLSEVVKDKMMQFDPEQRANMHQIMLWLQAYTGMELHIVTTANPRRTDRQHYMKVSPHTHFHQSAECITATVHQKMDALIAKDVELQTVPGFVEPGPKTPAKKKKKPKN